MKTKDILKLILTFMVILIIEITILTIVNIVPRSYIEKHVKESSEILNKEGLFPRLKYAYMFSLDNWTDAVMINTAYSVNSNEPFESAMLMRRNYRTNSDIVLEKQDNEIDPILNLSETLEEKNDVYFEYSRYWHGYMIYLRPLLVFFNYTQIRMLFSVIIIILSLLLIYTAYKNIDIHISIITMLLLLIANFYYIGMSLQYSSTFILMLISSIYIIKRFKEIKVYQFFFIVGCFTSFFDLLTAPLLTIGIPIIYYIILKQRNNNNCNIKEIIKILILWCLGYGLMWVSKWVISDLTFNTGTIQRAIQKVSLLTNNNEEVNVSSIQSIKKNIDMINFMFFVSLLELCIVTCFINKRNFKSKIPYIIVTILPFIWYALIKNHSYIHARFTYRNLLISIFGFSTIVIQNIIDFVKNKKV